MAFQGDISPLSSKEVIETWVMPVLLYGSEIWILTENLLQSLESFQGELANWFLSGQSITPTLQLLVPLMFTL